MGTMVIGKVESGSVCKGSSFLLMPNRVSLTFTCTCPATCKYIIHVCPAEFLISYIYMYEAWAKLAQ